MFIPIGDENPTERRPYVNYVLLAANVAAFLLFCFPTPRQPVLVRWAMIPAELDPVTLFSSLFLHANLMHLIGNMVFLWIFGDNVEDRLGHLGYAAFYLVCGLAADATHILSNPQSALPTLGASGAISGVMGAYVLFFPRHRVKMLFMFGFIQVVRTPAFLWIGFWFVQQVVLSLASSVGNVAYGAHIGGFLAGVAIAVAAKLVLSAGRPRGAVPEDILEASRGSDTRRPFVSLDADPGIAWIENPADSYAVLRLSDDLTGVGRMAEISAAHTGESVQDAARRIEATRGVIAKDVPRIVAERIQRDLHTLGLPSALILRDPANEPPRPVVVDAASWDPRNLRLRAGTDSSSLAWSSPFLYVAARVRGQAFMDVYLSRRVAFRLVDAPTVAYSEADPESRSEFDADLRHFARAVIELRQSAALNEGVRVLAHGGDWGWLSFKSAEDYDDYLFWLYNLILSQVPLHRG